MTKRKIGQLATIGDPKSDSTVKQTGIIIGNGLKPAFTVGDPKPGSTVKQGDPRPDSTVRQTGKIIGNG
ncbi:hypothetical protein [Bradyrhizobium lablabi]|uniref:hypothetical protein n=1 Tax=Bradyrhizobium lablabi TaxID=722472 RepID=UPI001BA465DB|nr:hypothetical protein [Bradyrhizobium lablabi]MBR0693110.1 hypothetical protein [Bradyrhizobium lablabi]